jgi:folate-binding protein YgfZ
MTISANLLAEYTALTANSGVSDLTGWTVVEAAGADRVNLLHSFSTNEVKKLPVGRGCEAFVTTPQGKTLSHVWLLVREDAVLLVTTPGQAATLIGHLQRYIVSEDVTLRDLSDERGVLLVGGARAADVLRDCGGAPPDEMLALADVRIADRPALLVRIELTQPASFLLLTALVDVSTIDAELLAVGASRVSRPAVEIARLEAGVPLFGQDITAENLPQEIGRDKQAISFTKGCYLGQETVARIDALGHVNRQLVGLRFEGEVVPPAGEQLMADGKEAGQVTSAAWSPMLYAGLALALVRRQQAKAGTRLTSSAGDAVVITLPVS